MKALILLYLAAVSGLGIGFFQDAELNASMERGKVVYADFCVTCHLSEGEGVAGVFPPLANSDYLAREREASIRGVKYGQKGEITVNGKIYNSVMMPMGLTDEEVADVMNYVMNSWGNSSDIMVDLEEVAGISPE